MWVGAAGGDHLVANTAGHRQVGKAVTVHVTQLPATEAVLDPTESVRKGLHAAPRRHCLSDELSCSLHVTVEILNQRPVVHDASGRSGVRPGYCFAAAVSP